MLKHLMAWAVAALTALFSPAAHADLFKELGHAADDGVRAVKKVVKKAKKKVRKAGKVVLEETEEVVDVVVDGSGKVIGEIDRTTGKTMRVALKGQRELEKAFSKESVDAIVQGLESVFQGARQAPMWNAVVAQMKAAKPAAERAARDTRFLAARVGDASQRWAEDLEDSFAFIDRMDDDARSMKRLGRLFQLVAMGHFGPETQDLAQWAADEWLEDRTPARRHARQAGLVAAPVHGPGPAPQTMRAPGPGNQAAAFTPPQNPMPRYPGRSFSLTLGWNVGAVGGVAAGFEGRFGVIMDINNRRVSDVRAIFSLAEGIGAGVSGTGVGPDLGVDLMVGMSSLPTRNASGLFFGPSGSAGAVISGNVSVDWGWANGNPVPVPIPSLAAGLGFTTPDPSISVLVMYGYVVTANANGFDHGIPGVPSR